MSSVEQNDGFAAAAVFGRAVAVEEGGAVLGGEGVVPFHGNQASVGKEGVYGHREAV